MKRPNQFSRIGRNYKEGQQNFDNPSPAEEIKSLCDEVRQKLVDQANELKEHVKKSKEQDDMQGKVLSETKSNIIEATDKLQKLEKRFTDVKQQIADMEAKASEGGVNAKTSIGEMFIKSSHFTNYTGSGSSGKFQTKASITDATAADLLNPDIRPGIQKGPEQPLRIRDLLTVLPTVRDSIEYAREDVFTNAADYQATQGAAKAESAITFTSETAPIRTIAHWIPVSKQILADVPALRGHIDSRLMYGLKLKEEQEILLGDGTGVRLDGLMNQATDDGNPAVGRTEIDAIRDSMVTVDAAFYPATGHTMNPSEWAKIETLKTSDGAYIFANPQGTAQPRLWGLPVVPSHSMAANTYLTGSFALAAELYDREQMSVSMAEQHANFFVENMIALLCEERIGLVVRRPAAFVKGTFTVTP